MVSDEVMIAFIGMIGSVLTVGMSLYTQAIVRRQSASIKETKDTIQTLEKNTNSIKDELVTMTAKAAYAKGVKHAKADKSSDDLLAAVSTAATTIAVAASNAAAIVASAGEHAATVMLAQPLAVPAPQTAEPQAAEPQTNTVVKPPVQS
jgi:hypothetical protein